MGWVDPDIVSWSDFPGGRKGIYHELLLDPAEALKSWFKFEVVVGGRLGDGGDDGNVVTFGAYVMGAGNDGNVDIYYY